MSEWGEHRRRYLGELAFLPGDAPTPARYAWALLEALGFDEEQVRVDIWKLEGRPAEKVRALGRELKETRVEARQQRVSEFAKEVPSVREAA